MLLFLTVVANANSGATQVKNLSADTVLFTLDDKVYWSSQIKTILQAMQKLDCLFGESTLFQSFKFSPQQKGLMQCSQVTCRPAQWGTHHQELLSLINILKAVELLGRRGGPFMMKEEKDKLLAPNAKSCGINLQQMWPEYLGSFINAEILFQDMVNGMDETSESEKVKGQKVELFKRDAESIGHRLYYVPIN